MTEAKDLYVHILAYFSILILEDVFCEHQTLMENKRNTEFPSFVTKDRSSMLIRHKVLLRI